MAPIALLGTATVILATDFSINTLTMFAMVLAIGILVDDAIVVDENVERIMAEEGLSPRDATIKAMGQISGAIIGITVVRPALGLPRAVPDANSVRDLPEVGSQRHHARKGWAGWFNRHLDRLTERYTVATVGAVRRAGRVMVIYLALVVGMGWLFVNIPCAFVPEEDQGYIVVDILGPADASRGRTLATIAQVEEIFANEPAVANTVAIRLQLLRQWGQRGAHVGHVEGLG